MLLRLGSLACLACLLAFAGSVAHAAKPRQAVFRATLTATLTKEWTFTSVDSETSCTKTTRGSGRWEARLATRRAVRLRAVALGGGKVRFVGTIAGLAGSAAHRGSMTVGAEGPPPCDRLSRSDRCALEKRSFKGASTTVQDLRRGAVRLARVRGLDAVRGSPADCPVPAAIRAIKTDLTLATGPLDVADVFGRNIPRFYTHGDIEQVSTLEGDLAGRVTERVRWTLVFTRLGR